MNKVLELQKLAKDKEGKGQAVDGTITTTWTVTTFLSTISNSC
ncbi:class III lanthipeptide [Paenibacillus polysaccharolyticus]|nr:class III lanthipeptide [Paenibacillus polysaccharolyticus]MCM3133509.1 class III lanthipeptide [Paenibacillus polysaccharolyticus]